MWAPVAVGVLIPVLTALACAAWVMHTPPSRPADGYYDGPEYAFRIAASVVVVCLAIAAGAFVAWG